MVSPPKSQSQSQAAFVLENKKSPADQDTFEMIPSVKTVSATLKDPTRDCDDTGVAVASSRNATIDGSPCPCHRPKPKTSLWIAISVVLGGALFLVGRSGGVSPDSIEELRSGFRRDLEALRSDVKHELEVHLLAASAVRTAAHERAIQNEHEPEHETEHKHKYHVSDGIVTFGIGHVLSAMESEKLIDSPPTCFNPESDLQGAGHPLQGGRLHSIDIVSSLGWIQDTILRQLQTIDIAIITSSDWIQNTINFANQHPVEIGAWFAAFFLLLYNCCRCGPNRGRGTDRHCDRAGVTNKAHDSSNPVEVNEGFEKCRPKDIHADRNLEPKPTEGNQDGIMEHMFDESVAAAANRRIIPRIYTGGNRTSNCEYRVAGTVAVAVAGTNTTAIAADPSPLVPSLIARKTISKKERRSRARINARTFATKDKQRLKNAASTNTAASASAAQAQTPSPAPAIPSPWTSKTARLNQARANAKLYAEQDKQRRLNAIADNPWKKHHHRKHQD